MNAGGKDHSRPTSKPTFSAIYSSSSKIFLTQRRRDAKAQRLFLLGNQVITQLPNYSI
jgi:hypothetical protein